MLGTLGHLGKKASKENQIKPNKTKFCNSKHGKKIYNTDIAKRIKKATARQAKKVKQDGFAQQFDTIMLDNTNGPVGVNQSNIIRREGYSGYDVSLQRDIDFNAGYSEFGKTQMHYDVVPEFEMMSSNMQPHTSRREYTNNVDYSHTLALHTGNDPFYMSKDSYDPVTIFEPMRDLTYVHGAPVMTDILEERYVPSYKNNNGDLPFPNKMKVQPGIEGETQNGRNEVYRILPKSTEEIRSKTNQKISYKADKIEAIKKGEYRSAPHNPTKFKKPTHRERDMDDYLPNAGLVNKRKQTGKYQKLNTNRSTSMNVVGHAHDSTKGNRKNGKSTESGKTTFACNFKASITK